MSFDHKPWVDQRGHPNARWDAAAAIDLEKRVSGYTDLRSERGFLLEAAGYSWAHGSYSSAPSARPLTRLAYRLGAYDESVHAMGSSVLAYQDLGGTWPDGKRGHNGWARLLQYFRRQNHPKIPFPNAPSSLKPASQLFIFWYGMADLGHYNNIPKFQQTMRAVLRRVRSPVVFENDHPTCVYTGAGWSTTAGRTLNSGAGYRSTSGAGDKVALTLPPDHDPDRDVIIGLLDNSGNGLPTGCDIKVNGSTIASVLTAGGVAGGVHPYVHVLQDVPANAVIEVVRTSGTLYFDYWSMEGDQVPLIVVVKEPRFPDYNVGAGWPAAANMTDANVIAHNAGKQAVADEFTDGMVITADLDAAMNKTPEYFGPYDNGHYTDAGAEVVTDTLEAAVLSGNLSVLRSGVVPSEDRGWIYAAPTGAWIAHTASPGLPGQGEPAPRFRRNLDGTVEVDGAVRNGAAASLFTVDLGLRPADTVRFVADANGVLTTGVIDPVTGVVSVAAYSAVRTSIVGPVHYKASA